MGKVNRYWNSGSGRKGTGVFKTTMTNLTPDLSDQIDYITARVKHTVYDPFRGSSRDYVWQDDALCAGVDPDLFQISQVGDPGTEDLNQVTIRKYNLEKVEAAQKICADCPVRQKCLDEAEPSELFWSVRGGQIPTRLTTKGGNQVPSFNMKPWEPPFECKIHRDQNIKIRVQKSGDKTYEYPYCEACNRGD